jgi:mannitol-specific phosphotransferase system IIBC component
MEPMLPTPEPPPAAPPVPATSLAGRLMNVFAAPGEVFAGIKTTPSSVANWLVPVLIFAVIGTISMCLMFAQPAIQQTVHEQQVKALDKKVQQGKMTQAQEDQALQVMEKFAGPTLMAIIGSIGIVIYGFASIFGWALVLWLAGRWLLKTQFDYLKALEVAGLSSIITALGMVITTLLAVILGRLYAGPSLALLVGDFDPTNRGHLLLGAVNVMNLWHAGVLAVGLAKLSGTPTVKTATAVFGFWVLIELSLIGIGLGQWAL